MIRANRGVVLAAACCVLALVLPSVASADWVEPAPSALNPAGWQVVTTPTIADIGGTPYVAFAEQADASGSQQIVVEQLVGSTWTQVGAPLDTIGASDYLSAPAQVASVGGQPYVTWSVPNNDGTSSLFVDTFVAGAWQPVGAAPITSTASGLVSATIADVGGVPYLAFAPHTGTQPTIVVERYASGWTAVGNALPMNTPGDALTGIGLASLGTTPYLAWSELNTFSGAAQVSVDSYTASAWSSATGFTPVNGAQDPSLAVSGGTLYLVYGTTTGTPPAELQTFDGSAWSTPAPAIAGDQELFAAPTLAVSGATAYVSAMVTAGDQYQAVVDQITNGTLTQLGSMLGNFATAGASVAVVAGQPFVTWASAPCSGLSSSDAFVAAYQPGAPLTADETPCPPPPPPLTLTIGQGPPAFLNTPFSWQLPVSGGTPPYTWTATALPPGLSIGATNGVISGTPTQLGTFNPTVTVTDSLDDWESAPLTFPINAQPYVAPSYSPPNVARPGGSPPNVLPPAGGVSASTTIVPPFAGVSLASTRLEVTKSGRVAVPVRCPANTPGARCDETGAIYATSGSLPAHISKTATRYAERSFVIAASPRASTIQLQLGTSTLRTLRAKHRLSVRLVIDSGDRAGTTLVQHFSATLVLA